MVVNVHILYLFSHCVSFVLLIIDFIVILHVRLIRVLLKINQSINQSHCSKSAHKFIVRVCQVATVAMETMQLVLSQFKDFLPQSTQH